MSTVDTIKERLSIGEVVSSYLKLDKAGTNLKGVCPFHNEKSPSFFVSPHRGSYYCFGCGAKGDIFSFVEQFEGVDFMGALKILAERAGVEIVKENPKAKSERDRLFKIMEVAALFYHKQLSENVVAKDYLKKRGVEVPTIREWRIGYAPAEWRTLHTYLIEKGFTSEEQLKVGLVKSADKGYYDTFRSRIVFPISDSSGRIVAFSGRIFPHDDEAAKYLNSPETILFNKSAVLYGYDKAKFEIRKRGITVLVEGQMDLIMSHQIGVKNAIATSGTAFTENHAGAIKRFSETLVICYDGDSAGENAALRAAQVALGKGLDVRITQLPEGKDPAELCVEDKEAYIKSLEKALHVIDFALAKVLRTTEDSRERGRLVVKEVLPLVKSIESAVEQSHFIRTIASAALIREDALWQELKKMQAPAVVAPVVLKKAVVDMSAERRLFAILYLLESGAMPVKPPEEFKQELTKITGPEIFKTLENQFALEKQELLLEAEITYDKEDTLRKDIIELLKRLEEDILKRQYAETMNLLGEAEGRKDQEQITQLLEKCKEIAHKLSILKKQN